MSMLVAHPDGEAKFWATPKISLTTNLGLTKRKLSDAKRTVGLHLEEMIHAWNT